MNSTIKLSTLLCLSTKRIFQNFACLSIKTEVWVKLRKFWVKLRRILTRGKITIDHCTLVNQLSLLVTSNLTIGNRQLRVFFGNKFSNKNFSSKNFPDFFFSIFTENVDPTKTKMKFRSPVRFEESFFLKLLLEKCSRNEHFGPQKCEITVLTIK